MAAGRKHSDGLTAAGLLIVGILSIAAISWSVYGWLEFHDYQQAHSFARAEAANAVADTQALAAQHDAAEWAYSLLMVAIVGTLLTVAGMIVLGLTLRETRRATEAARQTGQEQARAYLDVVTAKVWWLGDEPLVQFCLHNSGLTPATKIEIVAAVAFGKSDDEHAAAFPRNGKITRVASLGSQTKTTADITTPGFAQSMSEAFDRQLDRITIAGSVRYHDIYGWEFESQFVFVLDYSPGPAPRGDCYKPTVDYSTYVLLTP